YTGFAMNCSSCSASSVAARADSWMSFRVSLALLATCAMESDAAIANADVMEKIFVIMFVCLLFDVPAGKWFTSSAHYNRRVCPRECRYHRRGIRRQDGLVPDGPRIPRGQGY